MTVYLPHPYPDELLMSVVARHCAHGGMTGGTKMRRKWFGEPLAGPLTLPDDAERFVAHTALGMSGRDLLDRHTLLPYFEAYSADRRAAGATLRSAPADGQRPRLKRNLLAWAPSLQLCPACMSRDIDELGETYWRRAHQLPGVLVCADHGVPLWRTKIISTKLLKGKLHDAITAKREATEIDMSNLPATALELLTEIARRSRSILFGEVSPWGLDPEGKSYRDAFARKRLPDREDAASSLEEAFLGFFGPELVDATGVHGATRVRWYWLKRLLGNGRLNWPPLRHVMVQMLMDELPDRQSLKPPDTVIDDLFGEGPWFCPNPYGDHLGPSIETVKVSREAREPTAMASCDCGLVFSFRPRRGDPIDRPMIARVYRTPTDWEQRVHTWTSEGVPRREMLKRLGVQIATITGLVKGHRRQPRFRDLRDEKRGRWERLLRTMDRYEARKVDLLNYNWLYRNDREWLDSKGVSKISRKRPKSTQDWDARDRDLVQQLRIAADSLSTDPSSPRRTIDLLLAKIGMSSNIMSHDYAKTRLPLSTTFAQGWRESTDDYRERKLRLAAEDLRRAGKPVRATTLCGMINFPTVKVLYNPRIQAVLRELGAS